MESRRRLDERRAGVTRQAAGEKFFAIGERASLENYLYRNAWHNAHDRFDFVGRHLCVSTFEGAEIQGHVDFARAFGNGQCGGSRLDVTAIAPMRKADDR